MFLSAVSHFSHPVTEIPLPLFRVHEDELCALHEIGAKPLGPTFGDVVERVVAASAILLWYKPEGGRKLPAVLEAPEVDANMNQQSYPASRQKITQSPGTKQTLLLKALLIGAFFLATQWVYMI